MRDAQKLAREAVHTSGSTFGVPIISGMAYLVDAREQFNRVQRLHARLAGLETDTLAAAHRWAQRKAFADYYAGIDAKDALAGLQDDLTELQGLAEQSGQERNRLTQTIAQRRSELEQVRGRIQQAQSQRLTLEQAGVKPGDDSAFESYKQRYQALSDQLRDLQTQEALLSNGGFKSVKLDEDDPLAGKIEVEGPVIGLDELERRLAIVNGKHERYTAGVAAIEAQIKTAEMYESSASERSTAIQQDLAAAKAAFEQARDEMNKLAEQVAKAESAAIDTADNAVTMFERSRSAASALKRAAQQAQQAHDPQRQNERLRKLTSDNMPSVAAQTALAEANTVLGRIYAQQIAGLESLDRTWTLVAKAMPGTSYDAEKTRTTIDAAREKAGPALAAAADIYTDLADSASIPWLKISSQASLATVNYLRARVFGDKAGEYRNAAVEAITAAADAAGQDPHGTAFALLRDRLAGGH